MNILSTCSFSASHPQLSLFLQSSIKHHLAIILELAAAMIPFDVATVCENRRASQLSPRRNRKGQNNLILPATHSIQARDRKDYTHKLVTMFSTSLFQGDISLYLAWNNGIRLETKQYKCLCCHT